MKMKERVFFEEFESLYFFHGSTPNWTMQDFHFHNQYEMILFLSDNAKIEVRNRSYNANAGDLFLLNNKEYHRTCGAPGEEYHRYVLMFEPEILQRMAEAFDYEFEMYFKNRPVNFVHRLHLSNANLEKIINLLTKIERNISEEKEERFKIKIKLSILELVVAVNEMYQFLGENQDKHENENGIEFNNPVFYRERIEQIKKYIAVHVEEKLELDDIAKEFYLSRYYLSHYFKRETGFTVVQYITNQKIIAAKSLLKKGDTVTEVANRLSYNSDSHFISVFKKSSGITPKQYAKEKRKEK